MDDRYIQIINLKIEYTEKKLNALEDTKDNYELIEKYKANIEYYKKLKNEL